MQRIVKWLRGRRPGKPNWTAFIEREMPLVQRRREKANQKFPRFIPHQPPTPHAWRQQILQALDETARLHSLKKAGFRHPTGNNLPNLFEEFRTLQKFEQKQKPKGPSLASALADLHIHFRRNLVTLASHWLPQRRFRSSPDWREHLPHYTEWRGLPDSHAHSHSFFTFISKKLEQELEYVRTGSLFQRTNALEQFIAEVNAIHQETVLRQLGEKAMQKMSIAARHYDGYQKKVKEWKRLNPLPT